jgi:MacB-like periplasmic core domain
MSPDPSRRYAGGHVLLSTDAGRTSFGERLNVSRRETQDDSPLGSRRSERHELIEAEPGHRLRAQTDWVSKGFFEAVGIPQIAGRDFSPFDTAGSPRVVIVNQSLARALFGNANPLGRRIRLTQDRNARPFEIVGVVKDSRCHMALHSPPSG